MVLECCGWIFIYHIARDLEAELLSPTQCLLNTPQFYHFAVRDTNEVRASQHIFLARRRKTSKRSQMCAPQNKTKRDGITFTNHLLNGNASIRKAISKSLNLLLYTLWAKSLIWMPMIDKIGCENFICKSQVPCTPKFDVLSDNGFVGFDVHKTFLRRKSRRPRSKGV